MSTLYATVEAFAAALEQSGLNTLHLHREEDLEYAQANPGELLSEIEVLKAECFALQEDLRMANQKVVELEATKVSCREVSCRCGQ